MRRHLRRWFSAAIFCAVAVIAATAWAKTITVPEQLVCPGVDAGGNLVTEGSSTVLATVTINEKTRAFHGTVHATVTNLSGHNVTFIDSPAFELPPGTKSKYTVKANGAATLTFSGIVPPGP